MAIGKTLELVSLFFYPWRKHRNFLFASHDKIWKFGIHIWNQRLQIDPGEVKKYKPNQPQNKGQFLHLPLAGEQWPCKSTSFSFQNMNKKFLSREFVRGFFGELS